MNVWPFVPQSNISETLQWKTDVQKTRNNEFRVPLRNIPRTVLRYEHFFQHDEIGSARLVLQATGVGEIHVPLWTDLEYVGSLTAGTTKIEISTNRRYTEGGYLFLIGAGKDYDVVTIESLTPDENGLITISATTKAIVEAKVCPMATCRINSPLNITKTETDVVQTKIEFITGDNFGISGSSSSAYHTRGSNTFYWPSLGKAPLLTNGNSDSVQWDSSDFGDVAGKPLFENTYNQFTAKSQLSFSFNSVNELYEFYKFLYYIQGRNGSFLYPTWSQDIKLLSDIGNNATSVLINNPWGVNPPSAGFIAMIRKYNNYLYYLEFNNVILLPNGNLELVLTEPSYRGFDLEDYIPVGLAYPYRLDTDSVEVRFNGLYNISISASLYMPPILKTETLITDIS